MGEDHQKAEFSFPIVLPVNVQLGEKSVARTITLNGPMTVLLGPNGSGKTHLLRAIQEARFVLPAGKRVKFISAGRIGPTEQFRSVVNATQARPQYDHASLGSWHVRERRHSIETLEGAYLSIATRPDIQLKVRERLKKLFKRDFSLRWENSSLKVSFSAHGSPSGSYSLAREASGLLHVVGLMAAAYDDEIGILLIDEPEVSLHPQLQAFLLRELISVAGLPEVGNKKIIVISTHSTEFLRIDSPQDLPNLVFTEHVDLEPIQIDPLAGELKSKKVAELVSRMGQEHKLAFFARSPLLVEGPSDSIICSGLAGRLDIHIEAGGSQILPVVGKGQFPVVVKLLRLMGKSPIVLADADAFADGNELVLSFSDDPRANAAAISASHRSFIAMYTAVFSDFAKTVDEQWASIEALATQTDYWRNRDLDDNGEVLEEKILKRRSAFAAMFVYDASALMAPWKALAQRLSGVLDILESVGCFVLRKGTIESYFFYPDHRREGKPSLAADEVAAIKTTAEAAIKFRYSDVLRCLNFAASSECITEVDLIKEVVMSIAAPIIGKMRRGEVHENLNEFSSARGDANAELFDLTIQDGKLAIGLRSQILDVPSFPIVIDPAQDVVTQVETLVRGHPQGSQNGQG